MNLITTLRQFFNPIDGQRALRLLARNPHVTAWTLDWVTLRTVAYTGRK